MKHMNSSSGIHLEMDKVCSKSLNTGDCLSTKSLRDADLWDRPKQCPQHRFPLTFVRRYGRILKRNSLRGLEREHRSFVNKTLSELSQSPKKSPEALELLRKTIETSPMQQVGGACLDHLYLLQWFNSRHLDSLVSFLRPLITVIFQDKGLAEAYRVLKPGGRFMCLEFSQVADPFLRQLYDTYSFAVIPEMGELVANDRASYQYLVESIRKFSNQEELLTRMDNVGFHLTKYTNMTGGIVAIHEGWKPIE
mmetsp:Transcript_5030/g.14557  ORF Transcript_5030/g.14557 Transcript_5030/m.14557 type:complete len:251 (+) Transcript_5030:3689-4441(+)